MELLLSGRWVGLLFNILYLILTSIGYWKVFEKCGVKGVWSVVPFARDYHLGLCADRELDGREYTIISLLSIVFQVAMNLVNLDGKIYTLLLIPFTALTMARIVYQLRIYYGMTKVFKRRKLWILGFVFLEWLVAIIWGFGKDFVPAKKVMDFSDAEGARELGTDLDSASDNLTININKRTATEFFMRKVLLKDVHMNIPKGHMVLLLGGSGAGKTTFVNAVTGYEKADAKIILGDQDVYEDYEDMMYDIGFVPQQDLVRGDDTVMLTLSDAATLRLPSSVNFFKRIKRVNEVLEQFGLSAVKNNLVEKLSGGQRKRLSIAMEFISDPTLFILDEPDSGLDGVVARGLFEKLRDIADEGKIVIVITHTPDRVIDLFDDVIVLAKDSKRTGRLAWYGPIQEAYKFFGKNSMEEILLSINQKEEGGEGRAEEFIEKYTDYMKEKVG
jgi:ABC-type multidrug transport system ATPase subunit